MRDLRSAHGLRTSGAACRRCSGRTLLRAHLRRTDPDLIIETTDSTEPTPFATPDPPPVDPAHPTGAAPARPAGRLHSVTVVVATVAVVVALVGLVWGTRPLETPTQDCGTAFSFLLDGRVDVFVDPTNPPAGVTTEEAEANNAEPCQERSADRARSAGALVVGGTLLAAGAAAVDLGVRGLRWYRTSHMPPVHDHLPH